MIRIVKPVQFRPAPQLERTTIQLNPMPPESIPHRTACAPHSKRSLRRSLIIIAALGCTFASGCMHAAVPKSDEGKQGVVPANEGSDKNKPGDPAPFIDTPARGRVYSIGYQSVLSFEPGDGNGRAPQDLFIPVEGRGLLDRKHVEVGLQISGTTPIQESEYDFVRSADPKDDLMDMVLIKIDKSYVKRLKTGDRLEVAVSLRVQPSETSQKPQILSYARRVLTLYTVDDYRKVLAGHVPLHDIEAFPLPEAEATQLFGKFIANDYYVVKLSLRNSTADERLVNVGMISATGTAMIESLQPGEPSFTVAVRISPQSPVQVYAVLDSKENNRPRSWTFRSLEFVGALGTAAFTTFTHTPPDLVKGMSLFTGVGLPEGQKLFPDYWPMYQRNLVNFSMPELVKVPKESSTTPKFIFFSKRDLELVVADQNLFGPPSLENSGLRSLLRLSLKSSAQPPSVRVINLAFDNLEIPFETVFSPGSVDFRDNLAMVQTDLSAHLERLHAIQDLGLKKQITESLPAGTLDDAASKLTSLSKVAWIKAGTSDLQSAVNELVKLANLLANSDKPDSALAAALFTLKGQDVPSLADLAGYTNTLKLFQRRVLAGGDMDALQTQLDSIKSKLGAARSMLEFIQLASGELSDPAVATDLDSLAKLTAAPKADSVPDTKAQDHVINLFKTLVQQRTFNALADFAPDKLPKTKVAEAPTPK